VKYRLEATRITADADAEMVVPHGLDRVRCGRKTEERVASRLRGTGRWKRKTAYYFSATYISRNERERA